ncbi:TPA: phage tail protein I [Klebsiella variicola]|uniref:phage tail protein I n=1 Tax=Klebsiella quasipneumoniae TaxID=1463165 RepID=UPI002B06A5F3|nr:phage tail protein I [Klebsiella variicola]
MSDYKSILPPNSLPSECALEQASAEIIRAVPMMIRASRDPQNCPAHLLPWLAWEYGVDTWNTDWSEQEKRNVVVRAVYVHRHRGTRGAILRSLEDLPFCTTIFEWFEQTPPGEPYTFGVDLLQDGRPVGPDDIQDMKIAVLRAKNLRSWFGVTISGKSEGGAFLPGYMTSSESSCFLPSFDLLAIHVNGWTASTFSPATSFYGATYTLITQGHAGEIIWQVNGQASIEPVEDHLCRVVVTGRGAIEVQGKDALGRTITHTINPSLWFYQDGSEGTIAELESWARGVGGRVANINELTYGFPFSGNNTVRGQTGSLWSEWGDMAEYGWPGMPENGESWADLWATLSPPQYPTNAVYMLILAGRNNRDEEFSSNGTVSTASVYNTNKFRRCAILE